MKTSSIKKCRAAGMNNDQIYRLGSSELGLFGVAFFGHKGKPGDKRKLSRLWHKILSTNPS